MEEAAPPENDRQWHLDKKVPIALIVTLVLQTVTISWWAATTTTRLDAVERELASARPQAERVIRLEEKVGVAQQSINEVKQGINEIKAILARPR